MIDAAELAELERKYDAVFLGIGLGAIHRLGIAGEQLAGSDECARSNCRVPRSGALTTVLSVWSS